jgi:hypothetical protein
MKESKTRRRLIIIGILILVSLFMPGISLNNDMNEIIYIKDGTLHSMNADGSEQHKHILVYPVPVTFLWQRIPLLQSLRISNIDMATWSRDGDSIAFGFEDPGFQAQGVSGIITKSGIVLVCNAGRGSIYSDSQIQMSGKTSVLIVPLKYDSTKIIELNMLTCKESEYYRGRNIGRFLVSNNEWLAVTESQGYDYVLDVYDQDRNLVYTDNREDFSFRLAWSNDGDMLIYGAEEKTPERDFKDCKMIIYDFKNNEQVLFPTGYFYKAVFSPDGKKNLFVNNEGINLYDIETGAITFLTEGRDTDWRP